jgi:hypothetical protein
MKKQKIKRTDTKVELLLNEQPEQYKKVQKCRDATHKDLRDTMDIMKASGIRY